MTPTPTPESEAVRRKAHRMRLARRSSASLWRHLAHVGVLGWLFILPVVLGLFLGRLVSLRVGGTAPLLVGLGLGLLVGGYVTWRQVRRSLDDDDEGGAP